ncbi:MAG TPA: ABC transporter permease subunit [Candidatus Brocadiia bacterium]|nr:ABC transporter permease subunit [Candidatus Brocadiia bacterium]
MPIISAIGRRDLKVRLLIWSVYAVLTLGALSMIYPFLLMVSGSFKGETDIYTMTPVPEFLHDDDWLFRRYLESKYNVSIQTLQIVHHAEHLTWRGPTLPPACSDEELLKLYARFREEAGIPETWQYLGHLHDLNDRFFLPNARRFRERLRERFDSLDELNRAMNASYESWSLILMPVEKVENRRYRPSREDPFFQEFTRFKMTRPASERYLCDLDSVYRQLMLYPKFSRNVAKYNEAHGTAYASYEEVLLPSTAPGNRLEREDWEAYVRNELNLNFVRMDKSQAEPFAEFLRGKYLDRIELLNKAYGTSYASFSEIPFRESVPENEMEIVDWELWLRDKVPGEAIRVEGPRQAFERFAAANAPAVLASRGPLSLKTLDLDRYDFENARSWFMRECLTRNYIHVLDYVLLHGRGVLNTIIYCGLAIGTALIVNPLAAYALSRFKLPSTYKILLFCMATMAFPDAVIMIPEFLLLKNLRLLNTFSALVLPGAANGMAIFLLKGFFDSLPKELFEAADLDGAGEWTKFWSITMSLSKPILAVVALGAFTAAYRAFMFALIIIPDQEMWTIMVWLYQLQQMTHQSVTYAALIIAAVPTFLVFVFCQNIIMRGIVVPTEK